MKRFTTSLRTKINKYRKNKLDIVPLIEEYSLAGEDISGCILENFNRIKEDMNGCNFANCIFKGDAHFSHSNISQCNFRNTRFEDKVYMRFVNARGANFEDAWAPFIQYQGGDFRDALWCNSMWRLGSRVGYKAKISKKVLDLWGLTIE